MMLLTDAVADQIQVLLEETIEDGVYTRVNSEVPDFPNINSVVDVMHPSGRRVLVVESADGQRVMIKIDAYYPE